MKKIQITGSGEQVYLGSRNYAECRRRKKRVKTACAMAIGIVLLAVAAFTMRSNLEFLQTSIIVRGEVVRLNAGGSHPQIEFVTKTGERVSYAQGGMIYGMKPGDRVDVRYLPDRPSQSATVDKFGAVWNWTLVALIMGVGALVAGLSNLLSRP